jgi:hypothetical protein
LDDLLKDHSKIARLASLAEGTTYTGERGGRLGSVMRHPIVAGTAMGAAGAAASGTPLGVRFLLSLGAAMKADDIMNRYEAAKQIRELGGPDGVTGRYGISQSPSGGQQPSQRPAGPGLPPSPSQPPSTPRPAGPFPSGGEPKGLSPALDKLIPKEPPLPSHDELMDAMIEKGVDNRLADEAARKRLDAASGKPGYQDVERRAAKQLIDQYMGPERRAGSSVRVSSESSKPQSKVPSSGVYPEEARGREASARSGMTKDTPEARRAKAAERVAAKREEAGRTQQKTSLEDQARQLAGKVTPQSLKNVPLIEVEEAAKEFDHTPNQMIWRGLQKLKRSQGWTEDIYRGYLEDFILKSIDMKAKMP